MLQQDALEIRGLTFKKYITQEQIMKETKRVATLISRDYKNKNPLIIGVLNGAFIWCSDLIRQFDFQEFDIDFAKLSSYQGMQSTNQVKTLIGLKENIYGRNIIIVEDIIDTGQTMASILPQLQKQEPQSIKIASLLVKRQSMKVNLTIDYFGFDIEDQFVIGYGLDLDGWARNLQDIWIKVN